jgi:hypothetical protein
VNLFREGLLLGPFLFWGEGKEGFSPVNIGGLNPLQITTRFIIPTNDGACSTH